MVNRESLARFPDPTYRCFQASSYDRGSTAPNQPGWYANSDHSHYLRSEENEGREEWVMMDVKGAGAVVLCTAALCSHRFGLEVDTQRELLTELVSRGTSQSAQATSNSDQTESKKTPATIDDFLASSPLNAATVLATIVNDAIAEIGATSIKDMGKVMKAVMASHGSQVDGKAVGALVKAKLSG